MTSYDDARTLLTDWAASASTAEVDRGALAVLLSARCDGCRSWLRYKNAPDTGWCGLEHVQTTSVFMCSSFAPPRS